MEETFGRYRLLERLGRGGMAEVFKAKSFGVEGFEKVLVIKKILPELAINPAFVDMFVHEAKLAVRLSHANIVQVFDLGRVDASEAAGSSYFIAMEYVAGMDLATLLARTRRRSAALPLGLCVYIAAEIAKGLDHAHRRRDEQMRELRIVHRDVSPQNVLLSWEGEVKVTDFGIAKARDAMEDRSDDTKVGQIKGKYSYMSPEQARGKMVDARSDIFSLGTVLYELIAGVNPFGATTPFETLRRVQAGEYPPQELLRQDVPSELAAIVRRSLERELDKRWEAAGRLYEELLAYLYSSGIRFSANDLAEFLSSYREDQAATLDASDVLEERSPSTGIRERTPVEVPVSHSEARPDTGGVQGALSSYPSNLGERREVTALVLAFGGKGGLTSEHRARVKDTLARYGARLLDEEPMQMVSVFGLGDSDGRDAETAVRCAMVLLRQLGSSELAPSAGVHVGRVLLHASGEPARDARLGSLVSEAQELARSTEGRCAVSLSASRQVRALFALEPLPETTRLVSGGMLVGDVRAPHDSLGRFVGRKEHLRRMGEVLAAATRKQLRLVTVRGEQGIGKTRLLYEVERRLQRGEYNVGMHIASCPPRGREVPLAGLTSMLQVLCGVREGDSVERVLSVEPRLRALGLTDEERNAVMGQLGAVRAGQAGPSVPPLRAAFAQMVQSLCEDRLHIFAWDHAHALDEESIDVISSAAQRLRGMRGVFVLSTRETSAAAFATHENHEFMDVAELDEEETSRMVGLRAGLSEPPRELVAFCRERAGGHPLFLEELVKELLETHALMVKNGAVTTLKLSGEVAVPRPLRSLLASRVARLDAERKAALCASAILGDPVDITMLAAMLGQSLQQLERSVAELESRTLMRRAGPSTVSMASPMLREAVLESIPPDARRELHGAAAHAYETVASGAESKADRVALHLYESGDRDRAATFFATSGSSRRKLGQLEAAVHDLLHALDLADLERRTPEQLLDWMRELEAAVHSVRAAPALDDIVSRVVARIDTASDLRSRIQSRVLVASMMGAVHAFDEAGEHIERALELCGDDVALARTAMLTRGELFMRRGEFRRALEVFEKVGAMREHLTDTQSYRLEIGFAQTYGASGDRARALQHLDRAGMLADPGDIGSAVEREKMRALILYFTRDFHGSAAASERAVDLARAAGLSYEVALNLHNMGDSLLWLGNFARSHVAFRESHATCREYGYARLQAHNLMYLTFLEGEKGRGDPVDKLRELIEVAQAKGYIWDALNGRYLLGTLAFRKGDKDLAVKELVTARDLARECHNQLLERGAAEMLDQLGVTA